MEIILDIVLPVFGIALIGYIAARCNWFDEQAGRGLSLFVFNFAIPVFLFRTLAHIELPQTIPWNYVLAYYLGTFAIFGLGMLGGHIGFRRHLDEQGILGFSAAYSNMVLLGVSLLPLTFGDAATLPFFILLALHPPLLFTSVTLVVEINRGRSGNIKHIPLNTLKGLLRNPIMVGLLIGLLFSLFHWPVPAAIDMLAQTLGKAVTPCALFALGASLSRYHIVGNLKEAAMLVGLKNLLHPLLVALLAFVVFDLDPLWAQVAVLTAALPTGVNGYLFAQRYQRCIATVTTAIFLSTAFSVLVLSGLLFLFEVR